MQYWIALLALLVPVALSQDNNMVQNPLNMINMSEQEIKEMQGMVTKLMEADANKTSEEHGAGVDTYQMQKMLMMMMMFNQAKGWGASTATQNCQGYADVVFLLDSSGSITKGNFDKQLDFTGRLASNFRLRTNNERAGYQVSVVSFSGSVREEFGLSAYTNRNTMLQKIKSIEYMSQNTDTHKALKYALQNSFERDNGGRGDAVKIIIVVTDGRSNQPSETAKWAREVKAAGILVIAVGVGGGVDRDELVTIASGRQNIFTVDNYDMLDTIREAIGSRTCAVTVNNGGIVPETADFDVAAYQKFVQEQKLYEAQKEQELEILEGIAKFEERKTVEEHHEKEQEEQMKAAFMETTILTVAEEIEHYDTLTAIKKEMHHSYMFIVSSKMLQFCTLSEEYSMEVSRLIMHGDESWAPEKEDKCNITDMSEPMPMDKNNDPVQVAQIMGGMNETEQVTMFFSGMKDAVCAGLVGYLDQIKAWERQYPNFAMMI